MLPRARIYAIMLATILAAPCLLPGQNGGVVVLEEDDFEKVPQAATVTDGTVASLAPTAHSASGEVHEFDPKRSAKSDIQHAIAIASREKKHVLLEVGGNWCPYCKVLDRFFTEQPTILSLRQRNFVYVKVNFSEENRNEDVLLEYPLIRGFPHFYVLDGRGKLVTSQRVALLGTPKGYSPERFEAFFRKFGPSRR